MGFEAYQEKEALVDECDVSFMRLINILICGFIVPSCKCHENRK